jgi:hypothetical protein
MIYFAPEPISVDQLEYRLENPNTEEIYIDESANYRYGNKGFICNNKSCANLYCVNSISEIPDKCIYCGIT